MTPREEKMALWFPDAVAIIIQTHLRNIAAIEEAKATVVYGGVTCYDNIPQFNFLTYDVDEGRHTRIKLVGDPASVVLKVEDVREGAFTLTYYRTALAYEVQYCGVTTSKGIPEGDVTIVEFEMTHTFESDTKDIYDKYATLTKGIMDFFMTGKPPTDN